MWISIMLHSANVYLLYAALQIQKTHCICKLVALNSDIWEILKMFYYFVLNKCMFSRNLCNKCDTNARWVAGSIQSYSKKFVLE